MYMDGFHWSLRNQHSCLNLFMNHWTLDTRQKFVLAMVFVMALAVAVEGLAKLRNRLRRKEAQFPHNHFIITVIHGLQAFVGYILMLVTMTFSFELLLCVVIGLMLGYGIFFQQKQHPEDSPLQSTHHTTNPCCAFLEEHQVNSPLLADYRQGLSQESNASSPCSNPNDSHYGIPSPRGTDLGNTTGCSCPCGGEPC